ncbi:MAG: hypothetical protein GX159_08800 [Flavobacteriaceae bacterium]|jgi:tetratricopeptide (TPR) repeat protein|nr:hypothetical protein [Flavobacteriaceae bacterium]
MLRNRTYIFLLFFLFSFANSQTKSQKDWVDSLIDSAYDNIRKVENLKSIDFAQEALEKSQKFNYKEGIVWSHFYLAQGLFEFGKYEESLKHLDQAESINLKEKDPFLNYEIHRIRMRVFSSLNLHDLALQEQRKSISFIAKTFKTEQEKKYLLSLGYENLIVLFNQMEQMDSSYFYLKKNRTLIEELDSDFAYHHKVNFYTFLGNYFVQNEKYDSAIYFFQKSNDLADQYNFRFKLFNFQQWGDMYLRKNELDSALSMYFQALKNAEEVNLANSLPELYQKISETYQAQGKQTEAEKFRLKYLEESHRTSSEQLNASKLLIDSIERRKSGRKSSHNSWAILVVLVFLVAVFVYLFNRKQKKNFVQQIKIFDYKKEDGEEVQPILNETFEEIVCLAKENNPVFFTRFSEVYPEFINKLLKINPKLQLSELTLCAYIYLNFSTKDIAEYTFTSPRTVQTRKYNIRKKLEVPSEEDLYIWMKQI